MAEHDMKAVRAQTYDVTALGSAAIGDYLVALSHELRRRSDRDEILAETADHLWLAADQLTASGLDPYDAERAAVERFGRPELLARTWTTVPTGERPVLADPAATAGLLGVATFMLATLFYDLYALTVPWNPTAFQVCSAIAGVGLLLAGAPLLSLLADPGRRAFGPRLVTGAGLLMLASGWYAVGMGWFWPIPGTAFGIVAALAAWRRRESRPWLVLVALAWPIGTLAYAVGDVLNLGPMDRWYLDPVLPPIVGFWLGTLLFTAGAVAVALRLRVGTTQATEGPGATAA